MGIPGLARRAEPYAGQHAPQDLDGYHAVIDGPSLAYHAHKLALNSAGGQPTIPSYADINVEAIRWLRSVEAANIKVSHIVFDGSLPESKQAERVSRLASNNQRVRQMRLNNSTESCPLPTSLGSISHAFLAPSLREALVDTPYASITGIVAGEADDWCALHAKASTRSIVFTSDTDLLLYDYPPETLIIFFQDADMSTGLKTYAPTQMREKLQLDTLLQFAFALVQEPSYPPEELLRSARALDKTSPTYLEFASRYTSNALESQLSISPASPALQRLDVRVSEFVYQALALHPAPTVYLPLLIEEPLQASAWTMGEDFRLAAYSLLTFSPIMEHRRKAQNITPHPLSPLLKSDLSTTLSDLTSHLSSIKYWAKTLNLKSRDTYMLHALSSVLGKLNTPPPLRLAIAVLESCWDGTWAFIHLAARVNAAMYSLRVLGQVVKVVLEVATQLSPDTAKTVKELDDLLADLPTIEDAFLVPGQAGGESALDANADGENEMVDLVKQVYVGAGVDVTEQVSGRKNKRGQGRASGSGKKRRVGR